MDVLYENEIKEKSNKITQKHTHEIIEIQNLKLFMKMRHIFSIKTF